MTVADINEMFDFQLLTSGVDLNKPVTSCNSCDLLSWVMANGKENEAWITVQTHSNTLAVATLLDMACIIIPNNIEVDQAVITMATAKEMPIFKTRDNVYTIFKKFYEAGLR